MDFENILMLLFDDEEIFPVGLISTMEDEEDELDELVDAVDDRVCNKNENYFETVSLYDDVQFMEHFRVSRKIAHKIAEGYETSPFYHSDTGPFGRLFPYEQTLIFLWYAGHQTASFRDVADRFDITISCLHRVIGRLVYYVSGLSPQIIRWPTDLERREIAEGFQQMVFPNVVSVVDGSHVKIDTPSEDARSYCNRKKFFSIQFQVTCDHRMRITSLFAGYPGSVHDARVFRNSPLGRSLPQKCGNYYLLGDTAYPCSRHLITPFRDNGRLTRRHRIFNSRLSKCRVTIEHCIGLLKQKMRQLFHCKMRDIKKIVHFIRACCVLHNLALDDEFPQQTIPEGTENPNEAPTEQHEGDDDDDEGDLPEGVAYRNYLFESNLFT